jgi:SAM-dependent methyltransferase
MGVEAEDPSSSADELRFPFGRNWARFIGVLDENRIRDAEASLREMLGGGGLTGLRFLDIGSGSGLFSLAARRLGATVRSFDYDRDSVACTRELRRRYFPDDPGWTVEQGSVLDEDFLARLGTFDIVYSWGVLHHTGEMWRALENVVALVEPGGRLFIALYNDQGPRSERWRTVKRLYNRMPEPLRPAVLIPSFVRLWGPAAVRDLLRGRPGASWREYSARSTRGMSPWYDVVDWVGGYPFEVARPEQVLDFFRPRGFVLDRLATCGGGLGCNEFVFTATGSAPTE